jgi:hypothetical protein
MTFVNKRVLSQKKLNLISLVMIDEDMLRIEKINHVCKRKTKPQYA